MTQQQDVLEIPRRRRRALGVILLGALPLVVAGTAGLAASSLVPEPEETSLALPEPARPLEPMATTIAPVIAPGSATQVNLAMEVSPITVTLPPPPEPEPVPVGTAPEASKAARSDTGSPATSSGSEASGSKASRSETSTSSKTPEQYCSAPSGSGAAGGSVKSLLSAANTARAQIGAKPLSWSGSLASAAASWSSSMASKDTQGNGSALAHNPNRPGAENVAMSGSSAGTSMGAAIPKAHAGWIASYGHCMNIMNPSYSQMGAGAAATANGNVVYTTANFR
ncbi:CAP domain-containing protein [Demequina sp. NBRC 110053]|uniref:CAP domain-containing protein n=1 Tax=Demequina sp. NBRC 110053 TaxID=1570342 RepID=UPI000A06B91A|nr:CAP domain-containing protein [Demequina sp. NBRC 110053]